MKKVAGFAVILILAGFLTLYGDGLEGLFNISPFGGFAFPIGDMADGDLQNPRAIYRKSGYEFGISTEGFFEPGIGVGLNFRYAVFDSKELEGFSPDDKLQTINIGVHMKSVFFLESIV
ncbi:MAG: hypothetical protein GWO41_02890, partial [candidate division Zixibacteria bacterium]|nr:hypothetical protein [candidate division Zixibacteria bacterium]NIR65386.1 hypothetical protein [candidate division Zixibacteria bacterium]NIS15199.1 hypothetical protein [candidate division Zixibacteria bacterium]NIS47080.1 hypothetical protein [candidate division Zixibacteria bacterium]NIT51709.1 hypothetical protein [candidate division Zixibacteria bacterium]